MVDDKFKYYPLPPKGVDLMRQYKSEYDGLHDDLARLREEFQDKANARHAAGAEKLRGLWCRMAAMVGVDASKSWGGAGWCAEMRYLDGNFAALTHNSRFSNDPIDSILQRAASEEGSDPSDDLKGAPKGTTLN